MNIYLYSLIYIGENGVSYCIKELCNLSLEIKGPFMEQGGTPILRHDDDPCFCDYRSDLVLIVWCNQIRLTPSFCRKNQFVSITFISRDTWT